MFATIFRASPATVDRALAFALCAMNLAFFATPAAAQDASMRQRLKERWQQRQQQAAPATGVTSAQAGIATPGDHTFTIQHDGLTRMYRVHVPASYDAATPAPLLVALHGGGGNMDYQADDSKYGLISKSEQAGFVVVFPNGYSKLRSGKFATWNAGACCGGARDSQVDDAGFIRQVVANLVRQIQIDRNRIYATGMSNGAMMAYRLACEMPDVFAAIAAVAGTDNTRSCQPQQAVSVLHIHARDDSHVLYSGGAGPDSRDKSAVTDYTSVADTVAKWARLNGCAATPRRILDRAGAYCEVHASCQDNARVQLCVTDSGGHSWPGAVTTRSGAASQALSANDVMWEFFNRR